ncbi:hypothetical protein BGZ83_000720 [Gryganskiella cystojenkinii]|nr:hypothetical protein BGZ83_000720 [Gryganskiella cystojenkinii]
MTTVTLRLQESHEQLLKLYSSIPVLTPCLEQIKTNQAEFVVLNNRLRQLQEAVAQGQLRADKGRKQLDSAFTINKTERERAYRQEINELKVLEDERRSCLRQRDDVVTVRYQLHKQRATLLEETRQLKRVNESVFDRSKDEVANTDFPEELHWQLELKEYDFKISEVRRQVSKYNIALSNLARAANLTEAALMALLGYSDAAYKVWKVEYALKASQKMKICNPAKEGAFRSYIANLRTAHKTAERMAMQETQRLNAMTQYRDSIVPQLARIRRHVFQNSCLGGYKVEGWEDEQGRPLLGSEADTLVRGGLNEFGAPPGDTIRRAPISTSSAQSVPTTTSSRNSQEYDPRDEEAQNTFVDAAYGRVLRSNRDGHQPITVPDQDEQETSIDPNRPLVVHDGRVVLRAGRAPLSTLAPSNQLGSQILMEVDRERHEAMSKSATTLLSRKKNRSRSRSGRELGLEGGSSLHADPHQSSGPNGFSALGNLILNSGQAESGSSSSTPGQNTIQEREGRKKTARGLFGFARGRRGSQSHGGDEAMVPSDRPAPTTSIFSLTGRRNQSSIDISSSSGAMGGRGISGLGHRRNVPSISIQNENGSTQQLQPAHDGRRTFFENASLVELSYASGNGSSAQIATSSSPVTRPTSDSSFSRPRVMSMDEYVGVEMLTDYPGSTSDNHVPGISPGSAPLIPTYEEHQQHQAVDPQSMMMIQLGSVGSYDAMLFSLSEHETGTELSQDQQYLQYLTRIGQNPSPPPSSETVVTRTRSRSLSPNQPMMSISSLDGRDSVFPNGASSSTTRMPYQQHHYSFSDQTPDGRLLSGDMPPPDYVLQPPQYSV